MDQTDVFPAPNALDDAEAAALSIGYQTAWFALHRRTRITADDVLLVHAAAGGGVGSAAVQLDNAAGATVIGAVGEPEKARYAEELGADLVVDRRSGNFVSASRNSATAMVRRSCSTRSVAMPTPARPSGSESDQAADRRATRSRRRPGR